MAGSGGEKNGTWLRLASPAVILFLAGISLVFWAATVNARVDSLAQEVKDLKAWHMRWDERLLGFIPQPKP